MLTNRLITTIQEFTGTTQSNNQSWNLYRQQSNESVDSTKDESKSETCKNSHKVKPSNFLFQENQQQNFKETELKSNLKRQVYICVIFMKIGEIDTIKEQFSAEIMLKARWREPSLDFKSDEETEYDWSNFWSPQLYVENTIGEPKQHIFQMVTFNENEHAFICEKRRITGIFLENLELNHFPFDVQDLSITVATYRTVDEIKLMNDPDQPHSINKQSFIDEQEWRLFKNIESESKEVCSELSEAFAKRPILIIQCRAARRPAYFIWNLFLVTFLICSLSLVTFAVDKNLPQNRLQLSYTLVLTLVAFKFVVNQCLPKVSYLTYLDKYIISSMFFLTIVCTWHGFIIVINNIARRYGLTVYSNLEMLVLIVLSGGYGMFNIGFAIIIYAVGCKRRRLMVKLDIEYMEKLQNQYKCKGRRRAKLFEQARSFRELRSQNQME